MTSHTPHIIILVSLFSCFLISEGSDLDVHGSVRGFYNNDVTMTSEKRVLVTGGAGFIGYHVARALALQLSHQSAGGRSVVVIDNFNDFYDVTLKRDRAYELHKLGVEIHGGELCNGSLIKHLMMTHNFSHVIHLAAQASVRYSIINPSAYVTANIECYLVLLETIKRFGKSKLIYASSSSVYSECKNSGSSECKFSLHTDTDHPTNMYAASKRVSEILSDSYCQNSGLETVGLRFFTVYGPWGRPDMAVFKFAQSIENGDHLPLFTAKDNATISRDFTYIDDVVRGVLSAMDYKPRGCGVRFNLGYGRPVSLAKLIRFIEVELGKKAKITHLPLPPTERLQTWADIEETRNALNFQPKVYLKSGVQRFVTWYKQYYSNNERDDYEKERWFSNL